MTTSIGYLILDLVAALLAADLFPGSLAGARIATAIPAPALEKVFGVLVVLIGLKTIFSR
jgi:uncharacterized membrane protein YfcA